MKETIILVATFRAIKDFGATLTLNAAGTYIIQSDGTDWQLIAKTD